MVKLRAGTAGGAYDVLIGRGLTERVGELLRELYGGGAPGGGIAVVSDANVWALYGARLTAAMESAGLGFFSVVLEPGERAKSLEGLRLVYDAFGRGKLRRDGLALAFGGGVVGDLCGFAAATWNRGVDFVQLPTTLLAQVDSGIGGKTAINVEAGKNLVGAFYQPRLAVMDTGLQDALPAREYRCGMAEVIKYGAIRSEALLGKLAGAASGGGAAERLEPALMAEVVRECCDIKKGIVERDEFDRGERMLLNFGHSFGHAIERAGSYERHNHGEAVAMGMVMAARLGEDKGMTEPGTERALREILASKGLEADCGYGAEELLPHMEMDKKRGGAGLRLVLLRRLGDAFIYDCDFQELREGMAAW
ncbi:MAG: 3-dehydroquinate synthase [Clostridiales Family XIII bacterium]|jgi:3-dehydroquinate synthase|nr:3-dehydroquinate synthase [Clostridiales Family XIII bacterium]